MGYHDNVAGNTKVCMEIQRYKKMFTNIYFWNFTQWNQHVKSNTQQNKCLDCSFSRNLQKRLKYHDSSWQVAKHITQKNVNLVVYAWKKQTTKMKLSGVYTELIWPSVAAFMQEHEIKIIEKKQRHSNLLSSNVNMHFVPCRSAMWRKSSVIFLWSLKAKK